MSDFVFLPGQTIGGPTRLVQQHLGRLPPRLHFKDGLHLVSCSGSFLPTGMVVDGKLIIEDCSDLTLLPASLSVGIDLEIRNCGALVDLPEGLVVRRDLSIHDCGSLLRLPATISVGRNLTLCSCNRVQDLPDWDCFPGDLTLLNNVRLRLPERLKLSGSLDVSFYRQSKLPHALIGGDLIMKGSRIEEIPSGMRLPGNVDASNCWHLSKIGADIEIGGNLNLLGSVIKALPDDLVVRGRIIGARTLHVVQRLMSALRVSEQAAIEVIRQMTDLSIEEASDLCSRLVEGSISAYASLQRHAEQGDLCSITERVRRRVIADMGADSASLPPEHPDSFLVTYWKEIYYDEEKLNYSRVSRQVQRLNEEMQAYIYHWLPLKSLPLAGQYESLIAKTAPNFVFEEHARYVLREGRAVKHDSFDQFFADSLVSEKRMMRVYRHHASPDKIMIPDDYAERLDRLRELYHAAAGHEPAAAREAREVLAHHPLRYRVLPEHAMHALQYLPDGGSSVLLLDEDNPMDEWYRQVYSPDFKSAAACNLGGTFFLFKPLWGGGDSFLDSLNHEWAHRQANREAHRPSGFVDLHERAVRLEQKGWIDEATERSGERWAVHMEHLLSQCASFVIENADDWPIETSVLGCALEWSMKNARTPGIRNGYLQQRTDYLRACVRPVARQKLTQLLDSSDAAVRSDAVSLLLYLDGFAELQDLRAPVSLSLTGYDLTEEQVAALGEIPLERLDLSRAKIPNYSTSTWKSMPLVKEFIARDAYRFCDFEAADALRAMTNLEFADFSLTWVSDRLVPELARCSSLRFLNVARAQLSDSGCAALREALPDTQITTEEIF